MAFRHLRVAVQFLTRLPVPAVGEQRPDDLACATPWFPAAGLLIGAVITAATFVGALVDPWLAALFGVLVWVWATGALHLDGLADLSDAAAASHGDRARFMAVLKDPHVGAFGVVAIVLQLLAKLVLLRIISENGAHFALVAIPAAARFGPVVWVRTLPALGSGLADRCSGSVKARHLAIWAALIISSAPAAPWLPGSLLLIAMWWFYLKKRIGGVTGDCHGAGIEVVETGLLILAVGFASF